MTVVWSGSPAGEMHGSDRNFRQRRKAMAAGLGKHDGSVSGQDEAGNGAAGRGARAEARLPFMGAHRAARGGAHAEGTLAAALAMRPRLLRPLAQMGLAGPLAGPTGRVGPTGSAQTGRIGFLFLKFSEIHFQYKRILEKL
jgi:hypothetical protein